MHAHPPSRYAILGLERVGRFHVRHRAIDRAHGVGRTLKSLRPPHLDHPEARAALMREGRDHQAVVHPALERCHGVVEDPTRGPMLVLDPSEGPRLGDWLAEHGRFAPDFALHCCHQVLEGLQVLHRAGVVHGDVRPERVVLDPTGAVRLLDCPDDTGRFRTAARVVLAPEVVLDRPIPKSDVYGLAVTLQSLITGRVARPGAESFRTWPGPLASALRAASALDPRLRPSGRELSDLMAPYLNVSMEPPRRRSVAA